MPTVSTDSLQQIVTDALDRMAFVVTEGFDVTPGEQLAQAVAHAAVRLRGSTSYLVTVSATGGMVQEVAAGMLGCESDEIDPADHGRAMVCELANVLGGQVVLQLSQDEHGLRIGLPQDLTAAEAGQMFARADRAGAWAIVSSDLGMLMVAVAPD